MVSLLRTLSTRSRIHACAVGAALAGVLACSGAEAGTPCADVLPQASAPAATMRDFVPDDLMRLRDIGLPEGGMASSHSPLSVSPDGRALAFVVNRAHPETNSYCRALAVLDLASGRVRIVDRGGELITLSYILRGMLEQPGFPDLVVPFWSPDGRWIAYRKKLDGVVQVWRAAADGSGANAVTALADDAETVGWTADGARVLVGIRPGIRETRTRIAEEGRSGYLYDDRFNPTTGAFPKITGEHPRVILSAAPDGSGVRTADAREAAQMGPDVTLGARSEFDARSAHGRAWTTREGFLGPLRVHVENARGERIACAAEACSGKIAGLTWLGDSLLIVRKQGRAHSDMAVWRWTPGKGDPVQLVAGEDVLQGCTAASGKLYCLRENAVTPRRIVAIDPATGASTTVFDPNPEFRNIRLGTSRRLFFTNNVGLDTWGDLVLPPGYKGGRLPLVVVQYHSDGFLRGGTGEDYPVHAFAARGFAVLSYEQTPFYATSKANPKDDNELMTINNKDWAERRSLLSGLETGVRKVIDMGIADPARIGITGLSDGASTVAFALINSDLFAAAAMSSCCIEPESVRTYGGPVWARAMQGQGYPKATKPDPEFWAPASIAQNAARIDTPILMQLADQEYLLSLQAWTALTELGKPVEMYIYPDERHIRWQPVHKQATWERSLDWFDFWLRGKRDDSPAKAAQYRRWEAMRQPPK
ncbi:dipeptidyl aminopeptidase/acylaminoacyl peptidase [Sphingosinicella microcystinivorans]|uniref:Dipeptidyl aminopeptidase/acylaminoacyl peptidase n=2 Tax=Sphingosinicella microcystinivorans TaxID=335406 RepID=A0ABX9SVJ4_SPHMI|nr:dipeptidyl aminopeptidase/acylaminoacyl peptidase [Sphingosinicella microcystinivorans]